MKRFVFLMFFLLAGLVRAEVPEVPVIYNAPSSGYYFVIDDRILTCSDPAHPYSVLGSRLPGALFQEYSQALVVAAYYNEKWASTAVTATPPGLAQALVLPLRSGASDVVYWAVLFSVSCLPDEYVSNGVVSRLCPVWGPVFQGNRIKAGMAAKCSQNSSLNGLATIQDYVNFFADAQYQPDEPEVPDPEPSVPDCVYTVIDREIYFVFPESSYPSGAYTATVRGPALYATTKEAAEACADGFSAFLASYDWPWVDVPAVMPWTSPRVYKCIERFNGLNVGVFYRIVFQDYLGTGNDSYDTAYGQCLTDYSQVCGCGGLNVIQFVKPSALLSDNVTGASELNGRTLASASAGAVEPLTTVAGDVNFFQYTTQKVASETDVTGESVVTSTASASEQATINITNNTEVNTNLELGDAPAADSYSGDEADEKMVSDSDSLLTESKPLWNYIDDSSTEYRIDWDKLWTDVKSRFDDMFGVEDLLGMFENASSGTFTAWDFSFSLPAPFPTRYWTFSIDWPTIASSAVVSVFRVMVSFFLCYETILMSLRLFS